MTEFTDIDPRRILEETYGLEADITPLPSEYARTFTVDTADG